MIFRNIDDEKQKLLYAKWIFQKCQTDRLYFSPFFKFYYPDTWLIFFSKKKRKIHLISSHELSKWNIIIPDITILLSSTMLIIHDTYLFSRRNRRLFHPMKRVFHWKAPVRWFENRASEIRKPVGSERKLGSWRG